MLRTTCIPFFGQAHTPKPTGLQLQLLSYVMHYVVSQYPNGKFREITVQSKRVVKSNFLRWSKKKKSNFLPQHIMIESHFQQKHRLESHLQLSCLSKKVPSKMKCAYAYTYWSFIQNQVIKGRNYPFIKVNHKFKDYICIQGAEDYPTKSHPKEEKKIQIQWASQR